MYLSNQVRYIAQGRNNLRPAQAHGRAGKKKLRFNLAHLKRAVQNKS